MFNRSVLFNHLFSLIVLFPVLFSFVFRITGLPIPSYLFVIIVSLMVIPFIANNLLTVSRSYLKLAIYVFFLWVLGSILYTPSVIASKEKFIAIIYNTILPMILVELFFLFSKSKQIDMSSFNPNLLKYAHLLLWFCFIAYILFRQPDESGRFSLPGVENAIWFSRFVGMLLLIILCCTRVRQHNLSLYLTSVVIALLLMFGGGSRGPLLAVIIVFFIKQSYSISKKKLLLLIIGIISMISLGFIFIGGYLFETDFYSIYARFDLFKAFSDYNFQYMKGSGIGSYAMSFFGEDIVYYPHNVFLELFFENGLIGVVLFCSVLVLFFRSFKPNIVFLLAVYYLLASLVSGDIPGNNNLFIMLFISAYACGEPSIIEQHNSDNILNLKNG